MKKTKQHIYILGATGMLGHMLHNVLEKNKEFQVHPIHREQLDATWERNKIYKKLMQLNLKENSYVINCVGIVRQRIPEATDNYKIVYKINEEFPKTLSNFCNMFDLRFIQISTNCVFERSFADPPIRADATFFSEGCDYYAHSKQRGEEILGMIIRTSFIGPELATDKKRVGLFHYVVNNPKKMIDGYLNHYWNGLTTLELAKEIEMLLMIKELRVFWQGNVERKIIHLASNHIIPKYLLLDWINYVFETKKTVIATRSQKESNLTLVPTSPFHSVDLTEKSIFGQLVELYEYYKENKALYE